MNERLKPIEPVEIASLTDDERIKLLGALGLVDASMFTYDNPDEAPNVWKSVN